jgi:hypothetical protein
MRHALAVLVLSALPAVHSRADTVVVTADRRIDVVAGRAVDRPQITTARHVGSDDYADVALKQGIEGGYIPGPRIAPLSGPRPRRPPSPTRPPPGRSSARPSARGG